jgi:hypothetical protein
MYRGPRAGLFLGVTWSLGFLCLSGCGVSSKGNADSLPTAVERRTGAAVVDGCLLDAGQQNTLRSIPGRQVLSEVILLCLSMQDSGTIGLRDGASQQMLASEIAALHNEGYVVSLGVTAVDSNDQPLSPMHIATLLAQASWRMQTVAGLLAFAAMADGLQFAPPQLDNGSRDDVTNLVGSLSQGIRPNKQLGIFAPPSVMQPSDVMGGDAFDIQALAPLVDRVRLMTLDYSCCNVQPGPTIDAAWALDAANLALTWVDARRLDVAMPLYGTDFTAPGGGNSVAETSVTYDEAEALEAQYQTAPARGPGDVLYFGYRDSKGNDHQVFYDDTLSTLQTLATWSSDALPSTVGVIYYGLGAEDPTLWPSIALASH